ncbi:FAD-dependent monooxygenase [Promicromonospora sukumoe]|uniref:FAD-dependent monooxygenase n=1 Tax=Promicromonospora sukumoe TaxID=88382 RepID=UPI003661592B
MTTQEHDDPGDASSPTRPGPRVLVVGAGIAGLAVVRALRGWDARIEVVDREAAPHGVGAGIFLPGNAVRALRALALDDAVVERAVRIERQRIADHRGRVLFELDTSSLWPDDVPTLATSRTTVHAALLDDLGDAVVRWGTSPVTMVRDGPGVDVTFTDGTSGRYDLVIGADGAHSAVRRLVFGDVGLRATGVRAWRLVMPRRSTEPVWSVRLGRGTSFLTIPVGEDLDYCYLDVTDAGAGGRPGGPGTTLAEVAARFDDTVRATTDGAVVKHTGPLEEVSLGYWSRGRVLLVGDAAHATPPSLAQGAAMALEDAIVLGELLRVTPSIPTALREYERRRRPRVDRVQQQTRQRDRTRGLHPAARNLLLRTAGPRLFRANYRGLGARA